MATMASSSTEDAFWFENLRSNVFLSRKMFKIFFFSSSLNLVTNPFTAQDIGREKKWRKICFIKNDFFLSFSPSVEPLLSPSVSLSPQSIDWNESKHERHLKRQCHEIFDLYFFFMN